MAASSGSCEVEMGCGGEKCLWSATRHSCQSWCRRHASEWADGVVQTIATVRNPAAPAMVMVDRLHICGQKSMFLRCKDEKDIREFTGNLLYPDPQKRTEQEVTEAVNTYLASPRIASLALTVTACGLMGNPPPDVVSKWESQFTFMDTIEFAKWQGYAKRCISLTTFKEGGENLGEGDSNLLFRAADGSYATVDRARATAEFAGLMSDPALQGTRLCFTFDVTTTAWAYPDLAGACQALDVRSPTGQNLLKSVSGFGGRTFVHEPGLIGALSPALGGVHVALDCGKFVAQWHTMAHLTTAIPLVKNGKVTFKIIMLW